MSDVDERDERLGEVLDRAVRDLEPGSERVPRSSSSPRSRTARVIAAVMTAVVFVGAVAWAAALVGRDTERPRTTVPGGGGAATYVSADAPWTFEYPDGWSAATTVTHEPTFLGEVRRTTIVNGPLPEGTGRYAPYAEDPQDFTDAVGDAGAVVIVERLWNLTTNPLVQPDAPLAPGPFIDEAQPPGWTFRERARCEGTLCFFVIEWFGPAVSDPDRGAAEAIARSVRLGGVDRWTETEGGLTRLHDEGDLLTVTHPDDWAVAEDNLTPWLSSPTEILSLGTFPLRVSSDPDDGLRLFDAPVAPSAIDDMTAQDAFVSVQGGAEAEGFDDRPQTFRQDDCRTSIVGCGDYPIEVPFQAWWIPFVDHGRGFYLFVAIGNDASPELVDQTWAVADSLRFYPSVG
jgi:hypothetical protein